MGLSKKERRRLIERVMEDTAEQLGRQLSAGDREAILRRLERRGRPSKGWSEEQLGWLAETLAAERGGEKWTPKAEAISERYPESRQGAVLQWIKRHYPTHRSEEEALRAARARRSERIAEPASRSVAERVLDEIERRDEGPAGRHNPIK